MSKVKVKEINLERGYPTVDTAIREMVNQLYTYKRQNYKSVILVHGYGSSGAGGKIKIAVKSKLHENSLCGIVRGFCGGEEWENSRQEMLGVCKQLRDFERRIAGNPGVTVVTLK